MTGYEAFCLFQAIKLHFASASYDFFKYNGKSNISLTAFDNRKDKYHFHKLARKFPNKEMLIEFLVANFLEKDKIWVGDLLNDDADKIYLDRQKVLQSLSYVFENDCRKVFGENSNPNELLKTDGDYPVLLVNALRKEIHIETLCLLNQLLNFFPLWNKKIADTIRWPEYQRKVIKYAAFLPKDTVKYKLILKKVIS